MPPIGIMQGRLSPADGQTQFFPVQTWREEFYRAREAGLYCIEWVYEGKTEPVNPLSTVAGAEDVSRAIRDTGVLVLSLCADYYMSERLLSFDGEPQEAAVQHLATLVRNASLVGISYLVLPFVDSSSLRSPREINGLVSVLKAVLPSAERAGVELHLETDLNPPDLVELLESISHPCVRANYDIGNSAALGHNPAEELTALKPWLGSVHVKDRVLGGVTVPLGTGAADFETCFRLIRSMGFQRPLILQTAREQGVSEVELAIRNRRFVEERLLLGAN